MAKWDYKMSEAGVLESYHSGGKCKPFDERAWMLVKVDIGELSNAIKEEDSEFLFGSFVWSDTPEGPDFWHDMCQGKTKLDTPRLKLIYKAVTGRDYGGVLVAKDFMAGTDAVNNPSHYGQGKIECIDYIKDFLTKEEYIGYLRGNIAKYLHRWRYKDGIEDLKKAEWYLKELIRVQSND